MRRRWVYLVMVMFPVFGLASRRISEQEVADAQHEATGIDKDCREHEFERNDHPDAQWFPEAGLGLFIHWGISSVHGSLELSWGMMKNTPWDASQKNRNKVTPEEYYKLAEKFHPDKYDPDKWLKAAADAGFKYAVLTTKHHDGYALWPSAYGQMGTHIYMSGCDLLKPYVDACRKNGLKVGFYYSPPDWYFRRDTMSFGYGSKGTEASPHLGMRHKPRTLAEQTSEFKQQYRDYVRGQVEELLTDYGPIDVLWFDGSVPDAITIERVRELQPQIGVNDRQHHVGDFATKGFECKLPKTQPEGWWEYCDSVVGTWAYTKPERCQPIETIMERYQRIRRLGGNYLMNFAPRPNGEMPDCYYERMVEVNAWFAVRHY